MPSTITLIYCTFPDEKILKTVCNTLINERFIACYNIIPIQSCYWWKEKIENDDELVAILKTLPEKIDSTIAKIENLHTYEVPCIMNWEVNCNEKYFNWIKENVT